MENILRIQKNDHKLRKRLEKTCISRSGVFSYKHIVRLWNYTHEYKQFHPYS